MARGANDLDTVPTNYNDKGTAIMEMIYGEGYLSPGGRTKTQELSALIQLRANLNVLDVGSGLGGSAFYLAEHHNCKVQGIDLMDANVAQANHRAALKGLSERVRFVAGDAVALPFSDQTFDLIWGQDAWCHVDDKARLVGELQRVLAQDGALVFSDWLVKDPGDSRAAALFEVTASPQMATLETYQRLFLNHGLELEAHVDTSGDLLQEYRLVMERLASVEATITERYGAKVFATVQRKQQAVFAACEEGLLGSGAFVVRPDSGG